MQYTTVLIDLDDTIIDTINNSIESLNEIYDSYSFNKYYTFEEFKGIYMPFNLSLWEAYEKHEISKEKLMSSRFYIPFKDIGINEEKGKEINSDFMERTSSKKNLIEGSIEILKYLKQEKYQICVLSNGFKEVQYKKIASAEIGKYFDEIILSDDIGINKPDSRIFQYALNKMSATNNECIMIGDSWSSDIQGAYNSNINQIWYNPQNKIYKDFIPTHTVKSLKEIISIL